MGHPFDSDRITQWWDGRNIGYPGTLNPMPTGLKRYQDQGHDHLITFSCYGRKPYLNTRAIRDIFERSLEQTRRHYNFDIHAYVIMPEHVHLLVSEPKSEPIAKALQSIKLSVSKQAQPRLFWQPRYHDFNVITHPKLMEKLRYIHRNPVRRGLVNNPEEWPHSSYLTYLHRQQRTVHILLD